MKKVLLISGIVIVFALILLSGWYFLAQDTEKPATEKLRDVLPFGSGEGLDLPPPLGELESTESEFGIADGRPVANLFRVAEAPVAGFVVLPGATTTVRYAERATGHIMDAALATLEVRRITNTTLPKIYEAYFRTDGLRVLYRSLRSDDTVDNVILSLTPPRPSETDGVYTPVAAVVRGDIREAASSGNNLYFVLRDTQSIVSTTFDGAAQRTIFSSPFTSWRVSPTGPSLVIWTKASAYSDGYAYTLGQNGTLSRLLGPLAGLTVATGPTGGLAYSYNEGNGVKLFARETLTETDYEVLPATLAEKCAWGTQERWMLYCGVPTQGIRGGEPDNWYRGISRFSDNIWVFDTRVDIAEILAEPQKSLGTDLDIYQPQVSPNEDYFVFINKNDLSLWALKLER